MHELKVIGVEDGSLLLADDAGERFRIAVDEVLHARLRQASPEVGSTRKVSPKEIQAQIRAGMSAEDVAAVTGASLDDIRRFEGPVLAEREFVIESALAVPVRAAHDLDGVGPASSFGEVIRGRLVSAGALAERWASWKEQGGGWVVKLTFTADRVDHDARWSFDPKRSALVPLNSEAEALSQQGSVPAPLIPRLRAVAADEAPERSRFDSGAFRVDDNGLADTAPFAETPAPVVEVPRAAERGPVERAARPGNQTADLLEALRRRRGERDPMDPDPDAGLAAHPSTGTIRLVEIPLETAAIETPVAASSTPSSGTAPAPASKASKRGRASMPSWDDIVFGAKPDDD